MAGWIWKSAPVAALVAVAVLAFAASVPAATNLIANGTFEGSGAGSLSGWGASSGTLSLVAGNGGGHAARVTAATAGTQDVRLHLVQAGQDDHARRGLHAGRHGPLEHRRNGLPHAQGGAVRRVEHRRLGPAVRRPRRRPWQAFPTVPTRRSKSGDSLTVDVIESAPASGASFDMDNLALAAGTAVRRRSAPERPGRRACDRRRADLRDGHLVAVDRQRRRDRLRRLPRRHEGGTVGGVDHDLHRHDRVAQHDLRLHGRRLRRWRQPLRAVLATRVGDHPGGGGGGGGSGPCGTVAPSTAPYAHIVVIMDENLTVPLAGRHRRALHPHAGDELPVRVATRPARRTPASRTTRRSAAARSTPAWRCSSGADNIFHQLDAAGMSWHGLQPVDAEELRGQHELGAVLPRRPQPGLLVHRPRPDLEGRRRLVRDVATSPPTPTCGTTSRPTPCRASPGSRPTTAATCTG